MSKTDKEKSDQLLDEHNDINLKINEAIYYLIGAEWDSNTLKQRIETLMKQQRELEIELDKINWGLPQND